jgi:hypothetical protein
MHDLVSASAGEPPLVVAYLFTLRRTRHPLSRAWNRYFSTCAEGSYRIHVHADPSFALGTTMTDLGGQGAFAQSVLVRDSIKVDRMGFSMVDARLRLLNSSVGDRRGGVPRIHQFLSESCGPVTSCRLAHRFLARHQAASFVPSLNISQWAKRSCPTCVRASLRDPEEHLRLRLHGHSFDASVYRTSSGGGWVTLNREAAELILRVHARYRHEFTERNNSGLKRWQVAQECPDEVLPRASPGSGRTPHSDHRRPRARSGIGRRFSRSTGCLRGACSS